MSCPRCGKLPLDSGNLLFSCRQGICKPRTALEAENAELRARPEVGGDALWFKDQRIAKLEAELETARATLAMSEATVRRVRDALRMIDHDAVTRALAAGEGESD